MKKHIYKIIGTVLSTVIAINALMLGAYALFTDRETGVVGGAAGYIDAVLHEEFWDGGRDLTGGELNTPNPGGAKTDRNVVWAESTGDKPCYVRVRLNTSFEYLDEAAGNIWKIAVIPSDAVQYTVDANRWIEGEDGYWYYSRILRQGDLTDRIYVLDTKLVSEVPEFYRGKTLRYTMQTVLETAQQAHEAYKHIFDIAGLPVGVEQELVNSD
ncbi:MAG: hypothetical protein FWE80_06290 [Oscillospiraceae bacterium]|nr:hypothetical protein [Oscillospiraceae bacterium]